MINVRHLPSLFRSTQNGEGVWPLFLLLLWSMSHI